MRTTKLFAAILVAGLIASACQQDPDYVLPAIRVESDALDFTAGTEQTLTFTATRDWRVLDAPEWVSVTPDKGDGSTETQRVRVSVTPNAGYNRTGEFILTIGLDKARVAVSQPGAKGEVPVGTGTKEDPYTVTGVLRYIETLGADVESPQDVYVKGKISEITEAFSTQHGNASFKIKGDGDEVFTVYRALYLGNKKWTANDTQIKENDEVVICGKVINYKGNTPETQQNKAYIYSLNGETQGSGGSGGGQGDNPGTPSGTGTLADPYNVAGAIAAVANLTWTSNDDYQSTDDVYVKGKISKIADNGTYTGGGTYGNASFYIKDEGSDTEFYVFRALYLGNKKFESGQTDIKVGDEVVICGKLMNYRGNTPETVAGKAYLYSLNNTTEGGSGSGGQGGNDNPPASGDTASGNGTQTSPYNAAGAAAAVANLTWTSNTEYQSTDEVFVKGKISKIADKGSYGESGDYGNASYYISEDGSTNGTQFYIFRSLYFGKEKYTSGTDIKVGDEVIIKGKLMNYKGNTPETVANESCLYSLNGKTE